MSHAAHRQPKRRVRLLLSLALLALVVVVVITGLWAGSSLLGDDDTSEGSAQGGDDLSAGVTVWKDMGQVRGLTKAAGAQLRSSALELSDDGDVQAATLAVAWKATCGVVQGEVQLEADSIARTVLDLAADLGVKFQNDGERVLADAVLGVVAQNANDAAEKCGDLRNAGF